MKCPLCETSVKTWAGSDPVCAFFDSEQFNGLDNWNCFTMGYLRALAEERGTYTRYNDISFATIMYFDDEESEIAYMLVMSWYKNRGRVNTAWVINDETSEALTLTQALKCIKYYEQKGAK